MPWLLLLWLGSRAWAQEGFPYRDETLRYTINWPSGLSLGEGVSSARQTSGRWEFELSLDASVAGFTITDKFRSVAGDRCSQEFEKESVHGPRKTRETMRFDPASGRASRTTRGGGTSELAVGACARDALAFLYHARRELAQGRVPPPETIYYGGPYQIRLEYTGPQNVKDGVADRVVASVKGPASSLNLEMLFARDAARTPLAIRVPLALGTFSLELVR